jgi:tripartite ATP-independent transporter DctM subunit
MFAYIMFFNSHLGVDMFFRRFSPGNQHALTTFYSFLAMFYVSLVTWQLWQATLVKFAAREHTWFLGLPVYAFTGLGSVCLLLFAITLLFITIQRIRMAKEEGSGARALAALAIALLIGLAPIYFGGALAPYNKVALGCLGMLWLFTLILLGMPIGLAMLVAGFQGILLTMPNLKIGLAMVSLAPYTAMTEVHLSVIPMFLLMGELALISGISVKLFSTANAWTSRLPGGLAIASVSGCAGFAAVCGESIPTAMTMAAIALPEMRKKKYNPAFATACLATGGTLGILIPPSLGFIIYAVIVEESVGKLFMAGIIPGIVLACAICGTIAIRALIDPALAPRGDFVPWSVKLISLAGLLPMLLLFGAIIAGILTGTCTPAEGGAVGSLTAILYAKISARVSWSKIWETFKESTILTGKIFGIFMGVIIMGYFLAISRLPFAMADILIGMDIGKWGFMIGVIIFYILLGAVMNVIPMMMLTLPALYPTVEALGFSLIWFGVVCVLLMELGQITPPIGVLVFSVSSLVPDVPIEKIFWECVPFFFTILFVIILVIFFPGLALWLPEMLLGGS